MTDQINFRQQTILCADIVGSTKLYEALGDIKAKGLIFTWLNAMAVSIQKYKGEIESTIGDEILCLFDSPADAVAAACDIQMNIHEITGSGHIGSGPAQVKIGLHDGLVLQDREGISGDNIKIARWVTGQAKAEQILISRQVFAKLPPIYRSMTRFVVTENWSERLSDEIDVLEILWSVDDLTAHAANLPPDPPSENMTLTLSYAGKQATLTNTSPLITVGRSLNNQLVVDNTLASRLHFTVVLKRGRCVLEDKSTNGTFLIDHSGAQHLIRHEAFPLEGSGRIYLAHPDDPAIGEAIEYRCE